ncbi:MAG: hypothetical protein P4M11_13765 [Candidatus Pacebacteria bacterium]|nr:hypothetical protein [Candidatus Paceibacterota bacterium]
MTLMSVVAAMEAMGAKKAAADEKLTHEKTQEVPEPPLEELKKDNPKADDSLMAYSVESATSEPSMQKRHKTKPAAAMIMRPTFQQMRKKQYLTRREVTEAKIVSNILNFNNPSGQTECGELTVAGNRYVRDQNI